MFRVSNVTVTSYHCITCAGGKTTITYEREINVSVLMCYYIN